MNLDDILKQVNEMEPLQTQVPQDQIPEHLRGIKLPEIIPMFPKIVTGFFFDASDHFELKSFIQNYIEENEGVKTDHGYNLTNWLNTSKESLFDIDEPIVQKFKNFVSESYLTYNTVMHWDLKPDHFISECWINKTEREGYQARHAHSNCWVSGTYYLDFPEASSPIRFSFNQFDSSFPYLAAKPVETNPFNSWWHDIMPKEGMLLLWSSNLVHETLPNQSDSRVSISMNICPSEIDNDCYSVKLSK